MLSAGQDRLVDNRSNKSIFKKLISPSKKELIFSNAMHDLTLDPAVDDVANEIVNWIHQVNERRTKRAESKAADAKIISGSLHS
jgi:heterodisulfide reductase subunit A-like polyferredoxin